ncbi:tyrosine-protein phosphatase [Paeniglutamicibacter sp. NPDC012692]|uniref:tyrosine-protein phosphatase n=1 Tax=Paeniglutamicibacter sp. NPDC012692 TaxID=3364388 RepID=UPI0036BE2AB5
MTTTAAIALDGLLNFRDLGGLPTKRGTIRPGVIYRSESLSDLTDQGWHDLARSGISTVIDLRSAAESARAPGLDAGSVSPRLLAIPMLDGAIPTSFADMRPLSELYDSLVRGHGGDFARIAGTIADADDPVLIHCTAGKDRTGLAVAIVLFAVGASWDAVRADYSTSGKNLSGEWADRTLLKITQMGLDIPDNHKIRAMLHGTTETGFDASFEWINSEFGSVTEYLTHHGLTDGQLTRLQQRLVVH